MPTNCDASGCLRGSLAKVSFFAVSRRPGQRLCPSPSLGRVFYRPPNFSTTILERRRVLPEKTKMKQISIVLPALRCLKQYVVSNKLVFKGYPFTQAYLPSRLFQNNAIIG